MRFTSNKSKLFLLCFLLSISQALVSYLDRNRSSMVPWLPGTRISEVSSENTLYVTPCFDLQTKMAIQEIWELMNDVFFCFLNEPQSPSSFLLKSWKRWSRYKLVQDASRKSQMKSQALTKALLKLAPNPARSVTAQVSYFQKPLLLWRIHVTQGET